jgi:hypothetical protein
MVIAKKHGDTSLWQVIVLSSDNAWILFHAKCQDFAEVKALAGEARSMSPDYPIWIREPTSQEIFSWD